mmetsp:Transcript_21000/g.44305  ORF Transcript_21000/g.44305 Transcript_21000/m.44305 type:complete len:186 (+) Transcript_21000:215-772(+)
MALHEGCLRPVSGPSETWHLEMSPPSEGTADGNVAAMRLQSLLSFVPTVLVDDCPMMQLVLSSMFEEWGATAITVASDGQEAVDLLCQPEVYERSWLVFMDMQMPVLDGLEATRAIREWERSQRVQPRDALVIIGVSGDGDEETCRASAVDAGMDAMLSKPVKHDELLHCLNEVAAARHAVEFAA